MPKHHLEKGEQAALRKMANDIIGAQTKEIAEMRKWRKAWYGSAGSDDDGMHGAGHGGEDEMDMGG